MKQSGKETRRDLLLLLIRKITSYHPFRRLNHLYHHLPHRYNMGEEGKKKKEELYIY